MTFLELCQRLRSEAGISGSGPTTVISQSGEYEKVVNWIQTAYEDIQNMYATWKFLQTSFSVSTIATTRNYTLAALSLTDLATWKKDRADSLTIYSSVSDESYLTYLPWEDFKGLYEFGSSRSLEDRPSTVTVKPDNSLSFYPTPDAVYTVTGEYYKKAQTITADAHTPLIPDQYHMILVWRALLYYGGFAAADEKYAHGQNEYKRLLRELTHHQLPQMSWGEPLA